MHKAMRLLVGILSFACLSGSLCRSPDPTPTFNILNISNNPTRSENPCIVCDDDGRVAIVWTDLQGGYEDLWLVESAPGGQWTEPCNLTQSSGPSRSASMRYDAAGTLHLAWSQYAAGAWDIFYLSRPKGGAWAQPETISPGVGVDPHIGLDDSGRVHLLYEDLHGGKSNVCYTNRSRDGTWQAVEVITTGTTAMFNDLATAGDGSAVAVWEEWSVEPTQIYYASRASDGTWSEPSPAFQSQTWCLQPSLSSDGDRTHLVFGESPNAGRVVVVTRDPSGQWSEPDTGCDSRGPGKFSTATAQDGSLLVVWYNSVPLELRFAEKRQGRWVQAALMDSATAGGTTSLTAASDGRVHVAWSSQPDYPEPGDVFYTTFRLEDLAE